MNKIIKVGKRYQIVIPKRIRKQLGIKVEDELIVSVRNNWIVLQLRPGRYGEYMQGLGKRVWKKVEATEYVRKERQEWEK